MIRRPKGYINPYERQELAYLVHYAEDILKYCNDLMVRFQRIVRGTTRSNSRENEDRANVNHEYRQKTTWHAHRIFYLARRASKVATNDMASFDETRRFSAVDFDAPEDSDPEGRYPFD